VPLFAFLVHAIYASVRIRLLRRANGRFETGRTFRDLPSPVEPQPAPKALVDQHDGGLSHDGGAAAGAAVARPTTSGPRRPLRSSRGPFATLGTHLKVRAGRRGHNDVPS